MNCKAKYSSGHWPENAMIPTEFELCDAYDVSRITVRRALDDLVQRSCSPCKRQRDVC